MTSRVLHSKGDIARLATFLEGRKLPLTVEIRAGKHRTNEQNRTQRLWCNEISEQLGDRTPEEVRGYCKLTLGVPILRAENDGFREAYDAHIRPLDYETKLALMMEPLDWPTTRLMTVRQKVHYLDAMHRHFSEQGIVLTDPDPMMAKHMQRYRQKEPAA